MTKLEDLIDLAEQGYEDLTISEFDLIRMIKRHGANIPLLIDGHKVWVHLDNSRKTPLFERDISWGDEVELNDMFI